MTLTQLTLRGVVLVALTASLIACDKNSTPISDPKLVATSEKLVTTNEVSGNATAPTGEDDALAAVVGASEIPYPMYPNGTKYRVGGENGLKIVVFQTEDSFETVDSFYNSLSGNAGMARIAAMTDYVRYSNDVEDFDAWATHKPGIVIHQFENETAREAVGASAMAKSPQQRVKSTGTHASHSPKVCGK